MQLTGKVFTLIFCGVLLASIFTGKLPLILAGLYIVMSIVTFIAYAIDKSAAQNNRWRTKESTLHLFAVIGGWPGAFFAQNMLRHKSLGFTTVMSLYSLGSFWPVSLFYCL